MTFRTALRALSSGSLYPQVLGILGVVTSVTLLGWDALAQCTGGNPYCQYSVSVPCSNGVCFAWDEFGPAISPECPGNGPNDTVQFVTVQNAATSWYLCRVSNDDSDDCMCNYVVCSSSTNYIDADCDQAALCIPNSTSNNYQNKGSGDVCGD
jgi:hypothetical protein